MSKQYFRNGKWTTEAKERPVIAVRPVITVEPCGGVEWRLLPDGTSEVWRVYPSGARRRFRPVKRKRP